MTKFREFLDAASLGNLRLMKKIFRMGKIPSGVKIDVDAGDPDYWGDTALIKCSEEGHYECCKFLIEECGANPLKRSETDNQLPSYKAWFFEHRVLYHYLKKQEQIAQGIATPLQVRIHQNNAPIIKSNDKDRQRMRRLFSPKTRKVTNGVF